MTVSFELCVLDPTYNVEAYFVEAMDTETEH